MEFLLGLLDGKSDLWVVNHDDGRHEVRNTLGTVLSVLPGKDPLLAEVALKYPGVAFVPSRLGLSQRHPRMYRTSSDHSLYGQFGTLHDQWQQSRRAIKNLTLDMAEIFRRVEPDGSNADVIYGHEIRNLLALSAMEVESSWKAVLKANGYVKPTKPGKPMRYDTNDYVKLLGPLRLKEYAVQLSGYPRIAPFSPFADWDPANPTSSILWYDAYNRTKHDRESNFQAGTLLQMIHALGAAHVMMYAQFGQCAAIGMGSVDRTDFHMTRKPDWPLDERYVPWSVINGKAPGTGNWTDINYAF